MLEGGGEYTEFGMNHSRKSGRFKSFFERQPIKALLLFIIILICAILVLGFVMLEGNGVHALSPPVTATVRVYSLQGEELSPEWFLRDIQGDAQGGPGESGFAGLQAAFVEAPDTSVPGLQPVGIRVPDKQGNSWELSAYLYVIEGRSRFSVEIGEPQEEITLADFVKDPGSGDFSLIAPASIDFDTVGIDNKFILRAPGRDIPCIVSVRDTTPPEGRALEITASTKDHVLAADLVADVFDNSGTVICEFAEEGKDYSVPGAYIPLVKLSDGSGNETILKCRLTVIIDTESPVIEGAKNKTVSLRSSVQYREGVIVRDNCDLGISLSIDSSKVNTAVPGVYPVVYTAADASGNTQSVTITVTVVDVDEEEVFARADEILAGIINDGMSADDKLHAIYNWIRGNLRYTSADLCEYAIESAYDGFTKGHGDCFTYYAVSEILLTRAGIENLRIDREPGAVVMHYWNLVHVDGGWYHFDSCPTYLEYDGCKFTESRAGEYNVLLAPYRKGYYAYDHELYPKVVP